MRDDLARLASAITDAYDSAKSSRESEHVLAEQVAAEFSRTIRAGAEALKHDADASLREWSQNTVESFFELAAIAVLAIESESQQLTALEDILHVTERLLTSRERAKARAGAQSLLESLMLAIEDVCAGTRQAILEWLARLANAPEGVIPPLTDGGSALGTPHAAVGPERGLLRNLLEVGLYREVMVFLEQKDDLRRARDSVPSLRHILTPTVSFMSRKGGVGKSMLTLATATWYAKVSGPNARVCIIDLDFSGPVWQYLLFPEATKPSHFLNDLFRLDQGNQKGEFEFPEHISTAVVEPLLERTPLDLEGVHLSLLSVADLPRTSRFLSVAVTNNVESFFRFLAQLLVVLEPMVDLVIIDNAPGFGALPLLSHVITTSVRHGCSVVVSTPSVPDLWGTIIELSDLSLLDQHSELVHRPPLWIVNKADEQARVFLSAPKKIIDVANEIGAYNRLLPDRPVMERAVSSHERRFLGQPLPLDLDLLSFGGIRNGGGKQPLSETVRAFIRTDLFKAFETTVGAVMLPRLNAGSERS